MLYFDYFRIRKIALFSKCINSLGTLKLFKIKTMLKVLTVHEVIKKNNKKLGIWGIPPPFTSSPPY